MNNYINQLLAKLKDYSPMTYQHSINVSNLAMSFGEKIGLDDEDKEKLRIAGLLHDIGKLKVPLEILNKTSRLTNEEYEIIKKHPKEGADLLLKSGYIDNEIIYIILCHHERIDGLGYPNSLKGNYIPKLSRILSICDSFDAMYSYRPYAKEESIEYIKKEFINNSMQQFDSYYTSLFIEYLEEKIKTNEIINRNKK